jgi:photosystem II stability/assembly factor-like uncharacterized protein
MNRSARSAIRDDVLADYQEPQPGLAIRALRALPDPARHPAAPRDARHGGGRVAMQTLGVVMAALIVAVAVVGVRVARGEMSLPGDTPFGLGGLHPPAAAYSIVDNQFVSADEGWIAGQLKEHNGPIVVMGTTDGGKTWHEQFRVPDGIGFGSLHFWNALNGELVEDVPSNLPPTKVPGAPGSSNVVPRVYRTSDGGAHWQLIDRPVDWANIYDPTFFLSPQEGWRLSGEPLSTTARGVQHTLDGGAHWTTVATVQADLEGVQLSFRDSENGWIVSSQEVGYVVNASGQRVLLGTAKYNLYATHDGGRTWARQDLPAVADPTASDILLAPPLFFNSQDGVLPLTVMPKGTKTEPPVAGQSNLQRVNRSYVLLSHDGGLHWGNPVETAGAAPDGEVFFLDARHWLTSDGPTIRETFDAGKTWTAPRQVLANGLNFSLGYWNYINPRVIWAQVGSNMIVRSTDGGATWTAVTPPIIN